MFRDAPIAHVKKARAARKAALLAVARARVAAQRGACFSASAYFENAVRYQGMVNAHLSATGRSDRSAAKRAVKALGESITQARVAVRRCKL